MLLISKIYNQIRPGNYSKYSYISQIFKVIHCWTREKVTNLNFSYGYLYDKSFLPKRLGQSSCVLKRGHNTNNTKELSVIDFLISTLREENCTGAKLYLNYIQNYVKFIQIMFDLPIYNELST